MTYEDLGRTNFKMDFIQIIFPLRNNFHRNFYDILRGIDLRAGNIEKFHFFSLNLIVYVQ